MDLLENILALLGVWFCYMEELREPRRGRGLTPEDRERLPDCNIYKAEDLTSITLSL